MFPAVRMLVPLFQTPPVKEEEAEAGGEEGGADFPLVGDERHPVFEGQEPERVDEEQAELLLLPQRLQLPPQLHLLLRMQRTASLSKEQGHRILLHRPRDPVQ